MMRRAGWVGVVAVSLTVGFAVHAVLLMPIESSASSSASASASRTPSSPPAPPSSADMQRAFGDIYKDAFWGTNADGGGHSGTGSLLETTRLYRTFLVQFMKDNDVHSVVDAGCGDWEFSHVIDWTGIDYQGYDIVPSVVDADRKKYGKPNIQFHVADVVHDALPPADLLIVKEVLQHLPNAAVAKFLEQLPKYKHVLITSAVDPETFTGTNRDIEPGGFRLFDPTQPPFRVPGVKLLTYWEGYAMLQVVYVRARR